MISGGNVGSPRPSRTRSSTSSPSNAATVTESPCARAIAAIRCAAALGLAAPRLVTMRQPLLLRKRDSTLGQAFKNEIVELSVLDQRHRRVDAVAGEAGAAADAQWSRHGVARSFHSTSCHGSVRRGSAVVKFNCLISR